MRQLLQKAIKSLKDIEKNVPEYIKFGQSNKNIMISEDNFEEITPLSDQPDSQNITFIDGGNAEIIGSTTFSLQAIRVSAITYEKNKAKTKKTNFYCLAQKSSDKNEDNKRDNTTRDNTYILSTEPEQAYIRNISNSDLGKSTQEDPEEKCAEIRRYAELEEAINQTKTDAQIIVLDGSLDSANEEELRKIKELQEAAINDNKGILAVSKTSKHYTTKGRPASIALQEYAKKNEILGSWLFKAEKTGNISTYYAKLHPRTNIILRIDYFSSQQDTIKQSIQALTCQSKDPLLQGYPYGLILADSEARITETERKSLRNKAQILAKKDKDILNTASLAKDAHQKLDTLKF